MHDLLINIALTEIAERLDLCLPVIDEGRDVEELVVVGARLLQLAQGLVGVPDVGGGADLGALVPDALACSPGYSIILPDVVLLPISRSRRWNSSAVVCCPMAWYNDSCDSLYDSLLTAYLVHAAQARGGGGLPCLVTGVPVTHSCHNEFM